MQSEMHCAKNLFLYNQTGKLVQLNKLTKLILYYIALSTE